MQGGDSDSAIETSRWARVVSVLARVCAACSVVAMVFSLMVVFIAWMGSDPTPTQMALLLWGLLGVPIAAAVVGKVSKDGFRYFMALAAGWGVLVIGCVCALALFPRYPAIGPHEWLAFPFFVVPAFVACVAWAKLVPPPVQPPVMVAGPLAIVLVGALSLRCCWPGIHADLPISASQVRRHASHDMMGHYGSWGHARLSDGSFESFVRNEALTAGCGVSDRVQGYGGYAPEWFQPTNDWSCFTDARADAQSDDQSWCWYRVWRRGEEVYFSSGCGWM